MKDFTGYKIKEWNNKYSVRNFSRRNDIIAPSQAELKFYRKYLKIIKRQVKNPKLLVLGATPEIRDLGLSLGFEVFAIDINFEMIKLANNFLKIKKRDKEILIKADWLKIPFAPDIFDVTIGDISLNNLALKDIPVMLQKLYNWTNPRGYCIVRNFVIPDENKDFTGLKKDLNLWRNQQIGFREFYFRYRFGHCYPHCYRQKTKAFYASKEFKWLDKLYKQKVFNQREYQALNKRRSVFILIVLPIKKFLKMFNKYFTTIEIGTEVKEKFGFYPVKLFCGKVKK